MSRLVKLAAVAVLVREVAHFYHRFDPDYETTDDRVSRLDELLRRIWTEDHELFVLNAPAQLRAVARTCRTFGELGESLLRSDGHLQQQIDGIVAALQAQGVTVDPAPAEEAAPTT